MSNDAIEAEESFENWQDEEEEFFAEIESELTPPSSETAETDNTIGSPQSISLPSEPVTHIG